MSEQTTPTRRPALPSRFQPGYVLTEADLQQLDALVVSMQQRNEELAGKQRDRRINFLERPSGWWEDDWVGRRFDGRFRTPQLVERLNLIGYVPEFFKHQRMLLIEVDQQAFEIPISPGPLAIQVRVALPRACIVRLCLSCTETCTPKSLGLSDDDRDLAYKLTSITIS